MFGCFYKNELENKMPGMTIENIAAACEGTFVGDRDLVTKEIAGAVTDSRQVQKDYLFIPIKGARVDGHDFIPQVFEKGALVVLSDHALPEEQTLNKWFFSTKSLGKRERQALAVMFSLFNSLFLLLQRRK